jgi:CHAT domain-containing protein/Tfp pilus assembly protein PilF
MVVGRRNCIAPGLWAVALSITRQTAAFAQRPCAKKASRKNRAAHALWIVALLLIWPASSLAQKPAQPLNTSPSPSRTQSVPPSDLAAQEDKLIKLCNEQLNVKGQFNDAEKTAQQAVDLSQRMGDKKRIMVALLYLASAYSYEGREPEALEVFQRTADLAREIGNRKGLSRALNNIAGVLGDLGRFEESLSYLYQCMDVAREIGDAPMQYTALTNIGRLYLASGDPDKAEAPLLESLRIGRELKHSDLVSNPSKVATEASLLLLGDMEAARDHYQLALKYYEQVRESHPDNPQTVIELFESMAYVHQRLGGSQKAAELLQEAMTMAEKQGSVSYAAVLADLGEAQESLGQMDEALASEYRALAFYRQHGGNPDSEWQIERRIGHIDRALGRNEEALAHYENSIHKIERLRMVALNTEPGRASFVGRVRSVYAESADLLYDMHREADALEIAERGRARAFLHILAESRTGLAEELTPEQAQREKTLLARISVIEKELWNRNLTPQLEEKYKTQLAAAEDDLESFHLEVRHANPRYASIHYPEPINANRIQKDLLGPNTVLLEFLLGEKRSLVWAVTKDKLTVGVLPARKEIELAVEAYRKALTEKISALTLDTSLAEIDHRGQELYSLLLQPVESALAPGRSLIIVPDGALSYLPFETLVLRTRRQGAGQDHPTYLIERFPVVYAPSASALAAVEEINSAQRKPPRTLLAFGDPILHVSAGLSRNGANADASRSISPEQELKPEAAISEEYAERGFSMARLPFTRDEVLGISRLYPAAQRKVYLGDKAREETVKSEKLDEYRYIHFATHGFLDEQHPDRSGILFSREPHSTEDGVLQMGEIMRLKLNADMVTLSACSTGLGKLVNGEGILGLTRAFFYAGARNVTASLWKVNDSSTSALMKAFYTNLNHGLPESAALRSAKISLLHGKQVVWHHPYYWAAFILVGEGR